MNWKEKKETNEDSGFLRFNDASFARYTEERSGKWDDIAAAKDKRWPLYYREWLARVYRFCIP
ncbi:MAG: hypothetical protein LBB28_01340, partial [Synergistaceae bacterium]|nr:hypothetical protein [Synergistaceae bacterium]